MNSKAIALQAAYVHIPFCRRRCFYCDFPISVLGEKLKGDTSQTIHQYVNWLCQEIKGTPKSGFKLATIFFGGGTPSLLSVGQLQQILETLDQQFGITQTAEISIEIDPGTFELEQIQGFQNLGVNRFSLGVQAFQPELLQVCGRSHTVSDIHTAVDLLRQAEIENWSLDLISGLPQQTLEDWQDSLEKAIALAPTHISTYDLIVEAGTPFGKQYQPGERPLPSDESAAQMYRLAQQRLTQAGYEHYEISNYAKPGYQCRHNRVYWHNQSFYGFGMGAASYLGGERFTRPRTRQDYYQWVESEQMVQWQPLQAPESNHDLLLETLMLGFRLADGLAIASLLQQFGPDILAPLTDTLRPHLQANLVELWTPDGQKISTPTSLPKNGRLRLSDPEGFLLSNAVLSDLFAQFS